MHRWKNPYYPIALSLDEHKLKSSYDLDKTPTRVGGPWGTGSECRTSHDISGAERGAVG